MDSKRLRRNTPKSKRVLVKDNNGVIKKNRIAVGSFCVNDTVNLFLCFSEKSYMRFFCLHLISKPVNMQQGFYVFIVPTEKRPVSEKEKT